MRSRAHTFTHTKNRYGLRCGSRVQAEWKEVEGRHSTKRWRRETEPGAYFPHSETSAPPNILRAPGLQSKHKAPATNTVPQRAAVPQSVVEWDFLPLASFGVYVKTGKGKFFCAYWVLSIEPTWFIRFPHKARLPACRREERYDPSVELLVPLTQIILGSGVVNMLRDLHLQGIL